MDLVRQVLLQVEAEEGAKDGVVVFDIEVHGRQAYEHARMLCGAGYLDGLRINAPPGIHVFGLTWDGYDFLDSIRSDSIWSKVKSHLGTVGGSASIDVIKALASHFLRAQLGLPI